PGMRRLDVPGTRTAELSRLRGELEATAAGGAELVGQVPPLEEWRRLEPWVSGQLADARAVAGWLRDWELHRHRQAVDRGQERWRGLIAGAADRDLPSLAQVMEDVETAGRAVTQALARLEGARLRRSGRVRELEARLNELHLALSAESALRDRLSGVAVALFRRQRALTELGQPD